MAWEWVARYPSPDPHGIVAFGWEATAFTGIQRHHYAPWRGDPGQLSTIGGFRRPILCCHPETIKYFKKMNHEQQWIC
jgi:hypothetical protein